MSNAAEIKKEIRKFSDPKKAELIGRFFKTGKGEYGEGDEFLGVMVPQTRSVARKYFSACSLECVHDLLESRFHEDRFAGLVIIVSKFKKAEEGERKKIFNFYLAHASRINNWDLVDLSACDIVGEWLADKDKKVICELARSENIWKRRIAVVSAFAFIERNDFKDALYLAEKLLIDREDLIHKAVGWMLREVGKKDEKTLREFIEKHKRKMPRTALRYAIEKFDEKDRKMFLRSD